MAYLESTEAPPAREGRWPADWSFDADAFKSGMDFRSPEATPRDLEALLAWYARTIGEVPRYARFLARHRPGFLKAYRNRFEHALRDGLPKQMVPYLLLNFNVMRGFRDGIREAVLMARWLGLSRAQVVDAVCWAYFGGMDAISIADEAAGDVIDTM